MSPVVEELPLPKMALGEGPHWSAAEQRLYLVDILGSTLHSYSPATGAVHSAQLEECGTIGFVTPAAGGGLVVGAGRALRLVSWDGGSGGATVQRVVQELANEPDNNRINDGKADPSGRLWFGTMKLDNIFEGRQGSLYSWSKAGGLEHHLSGVGISNGLAWHKGAMYYNDSLCQSVDRMDFDLATGKIGNRQVVFDFLKNGLNFYPDGMTIDSDGRLWVACYSGSRVIQVDPETGKLVSEVTIPAPNVTSAAWGGPHLDQLFVTTAAGGDGTGGGKTFRVRGLAARGLPMTEALV